MRIVCTQAHLLSYPLAEPLTLPYYGGERTILKRDAMVIRVKADNGLIGYGPGEGSEQAKQAIDAVIAPFLEGRTLTDPDALRVHFLEGPGRDAELLRVYSAVEIALYDLEGKSKGLPVSDLLGGRVRDRIQLYGSAGMYMPIEKSAQEARAIAQLGFRAFKLRSGLGPEEDLDAVRRLREELGPDFDLMVDAQAWWRMGDRNYVPSAIDQLAERLDQYNVAWLEEPLPPQDHAGYRRIKELERAPIAAGAHEPDEGGYLDLIATSSVDYLQMDLVAQGGYATARRLLAEVSHAGLRFAFACEGTALDVIAAAQLGVCCPEPIADWLEYPCYSTPARAGMYPFPLAAEVLKEPLQLDHGDLVVPRRPGLGVDVDESVFERYPWIPGPWSFFRVDSPREVHALSAGRSEPWMEPSGEKLRKGPASSGEAHSRSAQRS
ncbi:MAG TPA: mandelate racemase/muconate lactonizing enzyme family protein [Bryobacteraceae bacterium]|nr:mandelate racemase/muconate lactonizing enzyme family protein [Bryobacteraceae bacterium]